MSKLGLGTGGIAIFPQIKFLPELLLDFVKQLAFLVRLISTLGDFLLIQRLREGHEHRELLLHLVFVSFGLGVSGAFVENTFFQQDPLLIELNKSRILGEANRTMEFEIEWGLPVFTPMIDVNTIGAGGGSLGWIYKGGLLRVGPQSAGASPGPACYRRDGTEATVTDANVALGRINPNYFLGGDLTLDLEAARTALALLGGQLGMSVEAVASSMIELVDFNMVNAIRLISIDRGLDPREFTLVSFGGAGSLHAVALAEIIGINEVLVPVHPGVFSAFGLMTADMRVDESVTASFRSDDLDLERANGVLRRLQLQAFDRLRAEGYDGEPVAEATIELRYLGQNYNTEVDVPLENGQLGAAGLDDVLARFDAEHRRRYGYDIHGAVVEFVNFNVTAVGATDKPELPVLRTSGLTSPKAVRDVYFKDRGWLKTDVYERSDLPAEASFEGPAVVEEPTATTLLPPGHGVSVDDYGNLVIKAT